MMLVFGIMHVCVCLFVCSFVRSFLNLLSWQLACLLVRVRFVPLVVARSYHEVCSAPSRNRLDRSHLLIFSAAAP